MFADGTSRLTQVLFGVDGGKSKVRQVVADPSVKLKYTGLTCLMGIAKCPAQQRGIHFPSSTTSKFQSVYFPTGKREQCFQIHFPIREVDSNKDDWADGQVRFETIAETLQEDG
jgi:2-polyprenyl-6-methoxyphenol hydroxylase-like FAD-dependent oxidoreductase